jgi:hypothetical protein
LDQAEQQALKTKPQVTVDQAEVLAETVVGELQELE